MASYGKIAQAQKRVVDSSSMISDRSSLIEHQAKMDSNSEVFGYANQILSSLGTVAAGFDANKESYQNLSTGATEAGVEGIKEWDELSFGDKTKIGFGLGKDATAIEDLDSTYSTDEGHFSTASLMEIGRKSKAGTLQPSLAGPDGKKQSVWSIYGQDSSDADGTIIPASGKAQYLNKNDNEKSDSKGFLGIGDGVNQTGNLLKAGGEAIKNMSGEGSLLESLGKTVGGATKALGITDDKGWLRGTNSKWGFKVGEHVGFDRDSSPYNLSNMWDNYKNKKQVASND